MEAFARCTTDLCVVVLQNSPTLTVITKKLETKQAIKQWKIEIPEEASPEENFEFESSSNENGNIITAKFRLDYYKKLEEKYATLVNVDKNLNLNRNMKQRTLYCKGKTSLKSFIFGNNFHAKSRKVKKSIDKVHSSKLDYFKDCESTKVLVWAEL